MRGEPARCCGMEHQEYSFTTPLRVGELINLTNNELSFDLDIV